MMRFLGTEEGQRLAKKFCDWVEERLKTDPLQSSTPGENTMNNLLPSYGLFVIGLLVCPLMMWIIAPFMIITINGMQITPLIINIVVFLLYCMAYEIAMDEIRGSASSMIEEKNSDPE